MNLEMLKASYRIFFECVSGSHAYGINVPTSDKDIRGFFANPGVEYLGLIEPPGQISDDKNDITYYSLKRAFELLSTANPNMIELLWMPDDCVQLLSTPMDILLDNRDLFITKKCYHTHSGYAFAQIAKAKGANKMVNHPELSVKPVKEDFCWIVALGQMKAGLPFRPAAYKWALKKGIIKPLEEYHVSAMEHVINTYRMYDYGKDSKGIFRGDDMLVCESIPMDEELHRFSGLLIYNRHEYEKAVIEHHKYMDWMAKRNESRWVDQEKGLLTYDQKNMCHCMRLLISGENILRHGFPLVRFEGEQREYLMAIRRGELKYEDIMAEVDKRMATLEDLYKTSSLPYGVNGKELNNLYTETSAAWEDENA